MRVIPSRLPIRSPDSLRNWRGRVTDAGAFHRDAVDHRFQLDAVCVRTKASCLRERSLFGRRTICCCHGTECRWCGRLCLSTSAAQCFRNVRANRISGARVLAFTWRKDAQRSIVQFSWIMYGLVALADIANLSVLSPHGYLWTYERPFYGIVQRALFATWFVWCGGVGILMRRSTRDTFLRS